MKDPFDFHPIQRQAKLRRPETERNKKENQRLSISARQWEWPASSGLLHRPPKQLSLLKKPTGTKDPVYFTLCFCITMSESFPTSLPPFLLNLPTPARAQPVHRQPALLSWLRHARCQPITPRRTNPLKQANLDSGRQGPKLFHQPQDCGLRNPFIIPKGMHGGNGKVSKQDTDAPFRRRP